MKIEFNIQDEDLIKFVENTKAMQERRFGEKKTNAEIVFELFRTGALRRSAARRWVKKQAKAAAPKKAKTPKAAKPKGPLARKQASKAKGPKVRKAKSAAAPVTADVHGSPTAAPTPTAAVLD
jgi:hypothetical protein